MEVQCKCTERGKIGFSCELKVKDIFVDAEQHVTPSNSRKLSVAVAILMPD